MVSSSEKKVVTVDQKVYRSNVVTNGKSDGKNPPHNPLNTGSTAELASEPKLSCVTDVSLGTNSEHRSNDAAGTIMITCTPPSAVSLSDAHSQLELKSESCCCEDGEAEAQSAIPAKPPIAGASGHPQGSNNRDDLDQNKEIWMGEAKSETPLKSPLVSSASDHEKASSIHNFIDHRGILDGVDAELQQQGTRNELIV
ncbi:hypothetical protein Ancab_004492 [Ancistrocladus abbreviatus]